MKSLYAVCLVALISVLSRSGFAAVNVGQVTEDRSAVGCNPTGEVFAEIPNLTLSLETKGSPILLQFIVDVELGGSSGAFLRPTIDGNVGDNSLPSTDGLQVLNGGAAGLVTPLSFTRVYTPAKGTHTFGVQMACFGSAEALAPWLTVIELHE
jgi:hypothetical protein